MTIQYNDFGIFAKTVIEKYFGMGPETPIDEIRQEAEATWNGWLNSESTGDEAEDRFEQDIAYEAFDIMRVIDASRKG